MKIILVTGWSERQATTPRRFSNLGPTSSKALLLWVLSASVLSGILYYPQTVTLLSQVKSIFDGSSYQAYQLAGLLFVAIFLLLRWPDLTEAITGGKSTRSNIGIRVLGLLFTLVPAAFSGAARGSLTSSAIILLVVWYGAALVINPTTIRFLLPYLGLALGATIAPDLLQPTLGQPIADLVSLLTRPLAWTFQIPLVWDGSTFQFTSLNGSVVNATISALCSSVSSISLFLLLLGLMQLDLKIGWKPVLSVALIGIALLPVVNALRIIATIFIGYSQGADAFWSVHKWIDYPIFLGFYCVATAYLTTRRPAPQLRLPVGSDGNSH